MTGNSHQDTKQRTSQLPIIWWLLYFLGIVLLEFWVFHNFFHPSRSLLQFFVILPIRFDWNKTCLFIQVRSTSNFFVCFFTHFISFYRSDKMKRVQINFFFCFLFIVFEEIFILGLPNVFFHFESSRWLRAQFSVEKHNGAPRDVDTSFSLLLLLLFLFLLLSSLFYFIALSHTCRKREILYRDTKTYRSRKIDGRTL